MDKYRKLNLSFVASVIFRDFEEIIVLHDRERQNFYSFDAVAADMLRGIISEQSLTEITSNIESIYEVTVEVNVLDDLLEFIARLKSEKLLVDKDMLEAGQGVELEPRIVIPGMEIGSIESIDEDDILDYCAAKLIPYTATWELTHVCNLRCIHCFCPPSEPVFWSFERVRSVLGELKKLGTIDIEFTGGECFTHPDIAEILKLAYQEGFVFAILSNGVGINRERAEFISKLSPRCVQLSIYSMDPVVHDFITGVSGSHSQTMQALELLLESGVRVHVACTIMDANVLGVTHLVNWAECRNIPIVFGFKLTRSENPGKNVDLQRIDSPRIQKLMLDSRINKRLLDSPELKSKCSNDQALCQAGFRNLCLSATGDVYPCNSLRMSLGNLSSKTLVNIWNNSQKLGQWRQISLKDYPECFVCPAKSKCEPCPASYYAETKTLERIHVEDCRIGRLFHDASMMPLRRRGVSDL